MPSPNAPHPVMDTVSRYRDVEERIFYVIPREIEEEIDSLILEANSRFKQGDFVGSLGVYRQALDQIIPPPLRGNLVERRRRLAGFPQYFVIDFTGRLLLNLIVLRQFSDAWTVGDLLLIMDYTTYSDIFEPVLLRSLLDFLCGSPIQTEVGMESLESYVIGLQRQLTSVEPSSRHHPVRQGVKPSAPSGPPPSVQVRRRGGIRGEEPAHTVAHDPNDSCDTSRRQSALPPMGRPKLENTRFVGMTYPVLPETTIARATEHMSSMASKQSDLAKLGEQRPSRTLDQVHSQLKQFSPSLDAARATAIHPLFPLSLGTLLLASHYLCARNFLRALACGVLGLYYTETLARQLYQPGTQPNSGGGGKGLGNEIESHGMYERTTAARIAHYISRFPLIRAALVIIGDSLKGSEGLLAGSKGGVGAAFDLERSGQLGRSSKPRNSLGDMSILNGVELATVLDEFLTQLIAKPQEEAAGAESGTLDPLTSTVVLDEQGAEMQLRFYTLIRVDEILKSYMASPLSIVDLVSYVHGQAASLIPTHPAASNRQSVAEGYLSQVPLTKYILAIRSSGKLYDLVATTTVTTRQKPPPAGDTPSQHQHQHQHQNQRQNSTSNVEGTAGKTSKRSNTTAVDVKKVPVILENKSYTPDDLLSSAGLDPSTSIWNKEVSSHIITTRVGCSLNDKLGDTQLLFVLVLLGGIFCKVERISDYKRGDFMACSYKDPNYSSLSLAASPGVFVESLIAKLHLDEDLLGREDESSSTDEDSEESLLEITHIPPRHNGVGGCDELEILRTAVLPAAPFELDMYEFTNKYDFRKRVDPRVWRGYDDINAPTYIGNIKIKSTTADGTRDIGANEDTQEHTKEIMGLIGTLCKTIVVTEDNREQIAAVRKFIPREMITAIEEDVRVTIGAVNVQPTLSPNTKQNIGTTLNSASHSGGATREQSEWEPEDSTMTETVTEIEEEEDEVAVAGTFLPPSESRQQTWSAIDGQARQLGLGQSGLTGLIPRLDELKKVPKPPTGLFSISFRKRPHPTKGAINEISVADRPTSTPPQHQSIFARGTERTRSFVVSKM